MLYYSKLIPPDKFAHYFNEKQFFNKDPLKATMWVYIVTNSKTVGLNWLPNSVFFGPHSVCNIL